MKNVPWFDNSDPDTFYPRCYRLSHEEEKAAFIGKSSLSVLNYVLMRCVSGEMDSCVACEV